MKILETPPPISDEDLFVQETINEIVHQHENEVEIINNDTGEHYGSLSITFIKENFAISENGDAVILSKLLKDNYLFDVDTNCWFIYKDGLWITDKSNSLRIIAMNILNAVYAIYLNEMTTKFNVSDKQNISDVEITNTSDNKRIRLFKLIKKRIEVINTKTRVNNVLEILKSYNSAEANDFDNEPLQLNCKNGVYDLSNSNLIQHNPQQKFKMMIGCKFEPSKESPYWNKFLYTIFNKDVKLIKFIQTLCGIWITGQTDIQKIFFAHGSGANGKSTFFNVLRLLLNGMNDNNNIRTHGLFGTIKIDCILKSKFQDSTSDYSISSMKGKRLIVASELPKNAILNESLIKDLTGGESIVARNPYEKPFSFAPNFKLCIFGNSKPKVTDNSQGFWRRIVLIPFDFTIPEPERREQSEMMGEFNSELSGILNWCIKGWNLYKSEGLQIPDIVSSATNDFLLENDIVQEFLDDSKEKLNVDSNCKIYKMLATDLFKLFNDWCQKALAERSSPIKDNKKFNKTLREKGYEIKKSSGNQTFVFGISNKIDENPF